MFLKELELVGFKSFPERTTLKFEPGIAAIVGPNGCGKSNIFDSIRWVLGEQSTKALRSLKMEDVIFNGTDGNPSLGMAEVSLLFCNKSRKLSLDNDEVEVRRRIFRSGESQYLLNKAPVRLRDILDLFMGTGIGAESYSLVEQGKVDLILSSHAQERRLIFDEASGITKYKTQKKEALRRLEETEQNLLRINDIITEVKREISSLERQANKARRYKQIFEEVKNKEMSLGTLEILKNENQKQDLLSKLNIFQKDVFGYEAKIQEVQSKIALSTDKIQQLEKEISDFRDQLINIDNLIRNNIQRIQIDDERILELRSRILDLEGQLQDAQKRIKGAQKNLENFQRECDNLEGTIKENETTLGEKQKEYEQVNHSIKSSQGKIKETGSQILDLAAASSQIKNEIADLGANLKSQALRKKRLVIERIKTNEEKDNSQRLLNQQAAELDNLKHELNQLEDEGRSVQVQFVNQSNAQEKLTQDIQDLGDEKIALQSQKEFLQQLRLKYEGESLSLNAVVYLDRSPGDNISGMIIRAKEPILSVEKHTDIIPENLKFKLNGEAKPMPLETETISRKIEQIQSEINQKEQERVLIQQRVQELNQVRGDLDRKVKAQEILISNKSLQIDNLTEQLNKISQESEVVDLELEDLENQIEQLNNKQTQLTAKLRQISKQQEEEEARITTLESAIADFRTLREQALIDITQIKTEIENQNVHLAQQEKTQSLLRNNYQESEQLYQRYLDEMQQLKVKIEQLSQEIENLKQQNRGANEEKISLNGEQDKQQAEFKELSMLREQDNRQVLLFNQNIEALRKQIHEYQMQAREFDFKQKSIRDRISQIYKVDLVRNLAQKDSEDGISNGVDLECSPDAQIPQDKQILATQIAELNRKLDSLGTVNLIAIEEYEELKKRYDFLAQQQNDLTQAKQSLCEAINKINRTARQMFLDTFKKIQVEFRNYLRMLFAGGEGQIILTDEGDPLESGIEIICRPPGKKLQNILALSGGEKALSAVALIFAIFKIKPAPFCVLDEVDAALDEANIGRFGTILQEFAKYSQFLIITHNKKTITNADVMYGITMQNSGISKIVSVKFS